MIRRIPRFMLAAPQSGGGKTTVTCAVLGALKRLGKRVVSFKCGPDYVDPMFHEEALGVPCANLDVFLMGEETCRYIIGKNADGADIAVIEGVMGYYDGVGNGMFGSSYHVARVTKTPVILVMNAKGIALTLAAMVKGLADFKDDSGIKGIVLNNMSERLFLRYREMIERECGLEVLGYLPEMTDCRFESRQLGLAKDRIKETMAGKLTKLAETAEKTVDWVRLMDVAAQAPDVLYEKPPLAGRFAVTVAVALDGAFCFYYRDALDWLRELGAELVYFSPLADARMPDCDGFILGGGYPERYLEELSANTSMLADIRGKIRRGVPCWAESGGFMVLFDLIRDTDGTAYKMAGVLKGEAYVAQKLGRFGYMTLTAKKDTLLCRTGERIHAHEFHYSETADRGEACVAVKPAAVRGSFLPENEEDGFLGRTLSDEGILFGGCAQMSDRGSWECVVADERRFMGFPHIHLLGNVRYAENFLRACQKR